MYNFGVPWTTITMPVSHFPAMHCSPSHTIETSLCLYIHQLYRYTMAPEVMKGSYSTQADVWSVGVIAFMLLSSQMPFYGRHRQNVVDKIVKGHYEFRGKRWRNVSELSKNFIRDILIVNPSERVTAEEAISSTWLHHCYNSTTRMSFKVELGMIHNALIKYSKFSRLKRVALMVIAHKSTSMEIGVLRRIFQKHDVAQVGWLGYSEFRSLIEEAGYDEDQARDIFDAVVSSCVFCPVYALHRDLHSLM
jgi:calcium-dependent protein kinase